MDISSSYYKRIVYKKNCFQDLKSYIKLYQRNKNILFLTQFNNNYSSEILEAINVNDNTFRYCQISRELSKKELNNLISKSSNIKMLICFGGEYITNLTKHIANILGVQYIVCPAAPTTADYFLPYYKNPITQKNQQYEFPSKIYIEEQLMKKAPFCESVAGLANLLAYYELFFSSMFDGNLSQQQLLCFEKILNRFPEIINQLSKGNTDANLVLLDNFIELGDVIKTISIRNIAFLNFATTIKQSNKKSDYDLEDFKLMATDLLFTTYNQFFKLKNYKINIPNYEVIKNFVSNLAVTTECCKDNDFLCNVLNNDTTTKINGFKQYLGEKLNSIIVRFKNCLKLIVNVKGLKNKNINIDDCFTAIKIFPYIYPNHQLTDIVAASGMLNF